MGYIVLIIILICCISGIIEIIRKKYPKAILFLIIPLLIIQTGAVLGTGGSITYNGTPESEFTSETMYYIGIAVYYISYFIWGILATIILLIYTSHYNKIAEKNNINKQ